MKKLLLKTILVAAAMCVGMSAWADETIGSTSTGWTEGITSAYTLQTGKTLTFTFTVDASAGTEDYQGYVAILAKTSESTWGENQYLFLRSACDYAIGGTWNTGAISNENTYGETGKVAFFTGATVNMVIKRIGTNVLVTTAITKSATTYYHYYQQNLGTTDDVYAFLAADAAQLTITGDAITDNGLTVETYNFKAANPGSSTGSTNGGAITVDGSSLQILENTAMDLKGRFAGGTKDGGVAKWYILRNSGGLQDGSGNASKNLAVLNLTAGDYVTITYNGNGAAFKFTGDNNITGLASGTAIVSGQTYKIENTGSLLINCARSGSNYPEFNSIIIATSKPVLERPTVSFNSMVESTGVYNPQFSFATTCDGVAVDGATYYDGSSNDITSGYIFTSAGTLTVYASKAGYTNSAKATYTVTNNQVGMILANSVNASSLTGTIDYSTGNVLENNNSVANATWVIPGLTFGTGFTYRYSNSIRQESGNRSLTCTVLNENRVATFKHYDYSTKSTIYDYLTSSSNSATFKRSGTNNDSFYQYDLYVNPSEEISVTIGSTGYSTFSSPVPLDFSGVSGLTAYVAKSVASGNVTLSSVTTAPANTGLVLAGTAGETYNIPVTASAETPASNLLVGCIVNTTVAADATSRFNNYVLVNEGGVAKFQSLVANGATVTGGKAFLKNGAYSVGARSLNIVYDETSAIKQVQGANLTTNNCYNLRGQRISQPIKGLYIVNGKKVVIK